VGITPEWIGDLRLRLAEKGITVTRISSELFFLLQVEQSKIVINCLPLSTKSTIQQVVAKQHELLGKSLHLINLWEDVWDNRPIQVLNRLLSLTGKNLRLHGRKTRVISLNKEQADNFLFAFHIQGPALARHKLGLMYEDELVAVATFSGTRLMKRQGEGYRSAELIRFATKPGVTVTGGLTKLIKHFANQVQTNDIMSYADRDWSTGDGYKAAGFTLHSAVPPAYLWLDTSTSKRYFEHRLPNALNITVATGENQDDVRFIRLFNTGSLKYILYL
jgi:hypothetical protein